MAFDREAFDFARAASGLSVRELALLYGVSRETLYQWAAGGTPSQRLVVARAVAASAVVAKLIGGGLLPFRSVGRAERARRVRLIEEQVRRKA